MKKLTAAIILFASPAFAQTPCNYTKDVQTNWKHEIQNTSNIQRNVSIYVENTRMCEMTMDVTIKGKTYPASGNYIFGPDMTENDACDQATIKAKKEIITIVSPEILTAKTQMNCSQKSKKPALQTTQVATIQNSGPVVATIQNSGPVDPSLVFVENKPGTGLNLNLNLQTNIGNILGALVQ
jgi:hypothetical protein